MALPTPSQPLKYYLHALLDRIYAASVADADPAPPQPICVRLTDDNGDYVSGGGGGGGAGTEYTEDAAAPANPAGTALSLVRDDTLSGSITNTDGDIIAARGNNKGEQYVKATDTDAVLGATTGAAIQTDADGTIQRYLRGIVKFFANVLDVNVTDRAARDCGKIDIAAFDVPIPAGANNIGDVDVLTLPSDPLGANADAAVSTDATGTISGKLRGIVKIFTTLGQLVKQSPQTAIVFTETGGSATFTAKATATGHGRVSNQFDRGAGALSMRFKWEATFKVQANAALSAAVRIYAYASQAASGAVDVSADADLTAETQLNNFIPLGQVVVSGTAVGQGPFYATGVVEIPGRYVVVALWNATAQTLTNVDGENKITLTPFPDQSQSWA